MKIRPRWSTSCSPPVFRPLPLPPHAEASPGVTGGPGVGASAQAAAAVLPEVGVGVTVAGERARGVAAVLGAGAELQALVHISDDDNEKDKIIVSSGKKGHPDPAPARVGDRRLSRAVAGERLDLPVAFRTSASLSWSTAAGPSSRCWSLRWSRSRTCRLQGAMRGVHVLIVVVVFYAGDYARSFLAAGWSSCRIGVAVAVVVVVVVIIVVLGITGLCRGCWRCCRWPPSCTPSTWGDRIPPPSSLTSIAEAAWLWLAMA